MHTIIIQSVAYHAHSRLVITVCVTLLSSGSFSEYSPDGSSAVCLDCSLLLHAVKTPATLLRLSLSLSLSLSSSIFLRNNPLLPLPSTLTPFLCVPFQSSWQHASNIPRQPADLLSSKTMCACVRVAVWDCNVITVAAAQGFFFFRLQKKKKKKLRAADKGFKLCSVWCCERSGYRL